jgi:glucose/arabinose dehydrogenase
LPVAPIAEPPGSQVERGEIPGVTIETVASNLNVPWDLDFTQDGDIFFTQRPGTVKRIQGGELQESAILELPRAESEGGTMGLALDPDFASNQYVYIYYTGAEQTNRVSRFRFNGDKLVEEKILVDNIPGAAFHNGGRIEFGPNGMLYAGTGDARTPASAQDMESRAGKILRIAPDGSIPVDNPDPNSYVYSHGHRNVQGLAWDGDGQLYATEHGSKARDEINLIKPGANYGWPEVEGNADNPSTRPPVENYQDPARSSGNITWAPSGAAFYTGEALPTRWHDRLLFAGLRSRSLWRYDPASGRLERLLHNTHGRLRTVHQGPDEKLYLLTNNGDGRGDPGENDDRILRISPQ